MTTNRMTMPDGEIINDYRLAKDKNAMIGILADQNLCNRKTMREYLLALGCEVPEEKGRKRMSGAKPKPVMDEIRAMELYEEGMDDLSIAEALGETVNRITQWRRRMHLKKKATQKAGATDANESAAPAARGVEVSAPRWRTGENGMPLFALAEILHKVTQEFPGAVIRQQGDGPVTGVRILIEYDGSGEIDGVFVTLL